MCRENCKFLGCIKILLMSLQFHFTGWGNRFAHSRQLLLLEWPICSMLQWWWLVSGRHHKGHETRQTIGSSKFWYAHALLEWREWVMGKTGGTTEVLEWYAVLAVEGEVATGSMNAMLWYGSGVLIFAATPSYRFELWEWMYICHVSDAQCPNFPMVEA